MQNGPSIGTLKDKIDCVLFLFSLGFSYEPQRLPDTIFTNSPLIYVRLHGVPQLFYSSYGDNKLLELKNTLESGTSKEAIVYFNNTAGAAGIENALVMKKMINS